MPVSVVSENPLLSEAKLPAFSEIKPADIEPAVDYLLTENRRLLEALVAASDKPSWQNFVVPLEDLSDRLSKCWSTVSHLHGVMNSDELRAAYDCCLPKLTQYYTELGHNEALFARYQALRDSDEYSRLNAPQRKAIDNALRDFRLSGVALVKEERKRFGALQMDLAKLSTQFSNNVLDATQGWYKHITDEAQLQGLPEPIKAMYQQQAKDKAVEGWVITLDIPSYLPAMQYLDSAALREELYSAYVSRASDKGPNAGKWDNSLVMSQICEKRDELAKLLDFEDYAGYSLAAKMADSPQQVVDFLRDLAAASLPMAKQEFDELQQFASDQGVDAVNAWDVPYFSEKLKEARFDISQQALRPYFSASAVLDGVFSIAQKLFAIQIEEVVEGVDLWHSDVRHFLVKREGALIARFYIDIYARENKRGGAWMADCSSRRLLSNGEVQLPVAYLVCNFTPPTQDQPSLLTHQEVTTLFHEFGHGLHHMLTKIDVAAVSGINGVAWDAVELPSQFLENWCWEQESLSLFARHYQTGEPLPQALLDKLIAAKNFQSGMQMVRQLEFALFDMLLHTRQTREQGVAEVIGQVRKEVAVYPVPEINCFQHSFSHIFAGGYAAGYYSYKWAEVLAADAFSLFEEKGLFSQEAGAKFLHEILEKGGSEEPAALFEAFRGREASNDALLRHSGIA